MHYKFDKNVEHFLNVITTLAKSKNFRLFFVGGCVRDNLLNLEIKDFDLIVEGNALELIEILPDEIHLKSVHKEFGTIKVEWQNTIYDIASTRLEKYPESGCLPVVYEIGVDIEKDVLRRDFTINSLYCEIKNENGLSFSLIDLTGGVCDIKNKTLRVLHKKSYIDDATRILRGVDFKNRFGFDFSPRDKNLILEYFKTMNLQNASMDRILHVFEKTLKTKGAFFDIITNKYYKLINKENLEIDFDFINEVINIFKPEKTELFYLDVLKNQPQTKIEVNCDYEIYQKFSKIKNLSYYYYKTKDKNALRYLKIKDIKLLINGDDIKNLGIVEGKVIGKILKKILTDKFQAPNDFIDKNAHEYLNY